jgi:signal transduction histidine kinase
MNPLPAWATRSHLKLTLYFLLLTGAALAGSWWASERMQTDPERMQRWWLLSVLALGLLGWLGVLFQRLRTLPARREELRQWAAQVRSDAQRYQELFESSSDLLLLYEAGTLRRIDANARARAVLEGRLPLESEPWPRLLRERPQELQELEVRAADGSLRRMEVRISGSQFLLISLRDRTREREMERELAIRERLSSIGLLTAGVAHEINNPLEGIANYLKLLENPQLSEEARARHLGQVQHGLGRIRDLVRELLRFARPQRGDASIDLAEVIQAARKLVALSEPLRKVEFRFEGFERPCIVTADAGRLEQVFVNLFLNAGHAMQGAGSIRVRILRESAGRAVSVRVEDSGPGIAPDHIQKLFDPFFTTGEGSGLGLSVSWGIVRAHGGTLRAENLPGGGACFVLDLPLSSGTG